MILVVTRKKREKLGILCFIKRSKLRSGSLSESAAPRFFFSQSRRLTYFFSDHSGSSHRGRAASQVDWGSRDREGAVLIAMPSHRSLTVAAPITCHESGCKIGPQRGNRA